VVVVVRTQNDFFEVVSVGGGTIQVSGSSGVALASGVYWYLENLCNSSLSWYALVSPSSPTRPHTDVSECGVVMARVCRLMEHRLGDNINVPSPPPVVPTKVRVDTPYKYRYYFNVCTFGYQHKPGPSLTPHNDDWRH
jgi:alpha-N-acetylglucosaminidase